MKYTLRCSYILHRGYLYTKCQFIDNNGEVTEPQICEYLVYTMNGDIYFQQAAVKHLELVEQAENNPQEIYGVGGQMFTLDISTRGVIFYCNEFGEEEGYPDLGCSLETFKTVLTAWNAFLQLPEDIHSMLEIEVDVEEIEVPQSQD